MEIKNDKLRGYLAGFTLIELLVVISIIALLLSILLPSLQKVKEQTKIVICASNQHQLLLGVLSYATSYGEMPVSIQGRMFGPTEFWTQPFRLNYWPEKLYPGSGSFGGGVISKILGDFISEAEIYSCPSSPPSRNFSRKDEVRGGDLTYQEAYETGNCKYLECSYWLLWNYDGWDSVSNKRRFKGPGKNSNTGLLVADFLSWNDLAAGQKDMWASSHYNRNNRGKKTGIFYTWYDETGEVPENIPLNAGYTDGHVERFMSSETSKMMLGDYLECYIPERFK